MPRWNKSIDNIKPTLEVAAIIVVFIGLLFGFIQFDQHNKETKYMYLAGT